MPVYRKIIYLLLLTLYSLIFVKQIHANELYPIHQPIPGGIVIIPLGTNIINKPQVLFDNKPVLVTKIMDPNLNSEHPDYIGWNAVVGIPLSLKPGVYKIKIYNQDPNTVLEQEFNIYEYQYPIEKLTLNPKFVDPSPKQQLRISQEQKLIGKAYKTRTASLPSLYFKAPIKGRKSSPFGLKRILNGQLRSAHSGIDLAAPLDTSVRAAAKGKVILTGDFYYIGSAVFIDHGQGLISNYSHLNSIKVKKGDLVDHNTIIGTVGTTGRSTGPHLHWTVSLNNVRVNPELFAKIEE